jgi:hypothetical protein
MANSPFRSLEKGRNKVGTTRDVRDVAGLAVAGRAVDLDVTG